MLKSQVIKLRELFGEKNLYIITDAGAKYHFVAKSNCGFKWDDANELFYTVDLNNNQYTQGREPLHIVAVTYDSIRNIGTTESVEKVLSYMDALGFSEEDKKRAKEIGTFK